MNINLAIVADDLKDRKFSVEACLINSYELDLIRFITYKELSIDNGLALDPSTAYIFEYEEFKELLQNNTLPKNSIVCGIHRLDNIPDNINILFLPKTKISNELLLILSRIAQKYYRWSSHLLEFALSTLDSDESVALEAIKLLKNPMLLFNPSNVAVTAQGKLPADFKDKRWIETAEMLERGETPGTFETPVQAKNKTEPYVLTDKKETGYSYLVLNITTGKEYFGCFVFCDVHRPFTLGFISIAKYFCDLWRLISEYSQKANLIGNQTTSFFIEILSNRHINESWFKAHKSFYNWEQTVVNRLIVGIGNSPEMTSELTSVSKQLEMIFPSSVCFIYQNSVCCLLNKQDSHDNEIIKKRLRAHFMKKNLEFGISEQFYDIRRLKKYYKQCLTAIQESNVTENTIYFYTSEMFFNEFLSYYKIDIENEWLIHPKVQLLQNHDKNFGTDYVRCLHAFIENGCNIKNTAKALYIHYNTLDYRLQKIKDICFFDPKNLQATNENIFQIFLSCKLLTRQ